MTQPSTHDQVQRWNRRHGRGTEVLYERLVTWTLQEARVVEGRALVPLHHVGLVPLRQVVVLDRSDLAHLACGLTPCSRCGAPKLYPCIGLRPRRVHSARTAAMGPLIEADLQRRAAAGLLPGPEHR